MKISKLRLFLVVILIFVVVVSFAYCFLWLPQQERTSFENRYLNIMEKLNSTETKTVLRSKFDKDYNFTELYEWVNEQIRFVPFNETIEHRYTDPFCILGYGKGRCGEFSILYVAVCLAHGYQGRLIVATNISDPRNWYGEHVWAEVKLNNCWVHVDPSEQKWNETSIYETWPWGKDIGSKIKIYAFEDGKYEDVTLNYKRKD